MEARQGYQPIDLKDPDANRLQAALATYLAKVDDRVLQLEAPPVRIVTGDYRMGAETLVDYRGQGGHSIVLPAPDSFGKGKLRTVYLMNNGKGAVSWVAPPKSTVDDGQLVSVPALRLATAGANGQDAWRTSLASSGGGASAALWFSPVTSAQMVGATSSVGDLTVGPSMRPLVDMTCRGIRFYWKVPASSPTSRTVRVTLWCPNDLAALHQTDMVVAGTGTYTYEFGATTLEAYKNYIPSIFDTHGTPGARVFTETSTQEASAGYPQGQRQDDDGTTIDVNAATFFGPRLLYVVGLHHGDDSLPETPSHRRYPTELILDDVAL